MRKLAAGLITVLLISFAFADVPIKLGLLAPLTGSAALEGESARAGVELAAERLNNRGGMLGRQLKVVVYDDAGDAKTAHRLAQQLIGLDEVDFAIGASTPAATAAAARAFEEAGITFIATTGAISETGTGQRYVFYTGPTAAAQARTAASAADNLGAERIAVLGTNDAFGRAYESSLEQQANRQGAKIVFADHYNAGTSDFTPYLQRIQAANADALYLDGHAGDIAHLKAEMRKAGLDIPIIGPATFDTSQFTGMPGGASEGVYIVSGLDRNSTDKTTKRFMSSYAERTGQPANLAAAAAYSAVQLLDRAVKDAGEVGHIAVRNSTAQLKKLDLVTGRFHRFDDSGVAVMNTSVQQVKDGAFHRYMSVRAPGGTTR